jgi:hypothetical protein
MRIDENGTWLSLIYFRPGQLPLTELERRAAVAQATAPATAANPAPAAKDRDPLHGQVEAPKPADSHDPPLADQSDGVAAEPRPCEKGRRQTEATRDQAAHPGPGQQQPGAPRRAVGSASRDSLGLADLAGEPDSFRRQSEALRRLTRYLKRVPAAEDGLDFLKANNLFTGPWGENLSRRKTRVRGILKFLARDFDAGKCGNGPVNVGKYESWAREKFPEGLVGGTADYLTEEGEVVRVTKNLRIRPDFIAVFMAVCEFALLTDKNRDGSLPHERAKSLWDKLYAVGAIRVKFNARKWAACRDELEKQGVIEVVDRDYGHGKAMRWSVGAYFPFLGLWKTPRQPSLRGPADPAAVFPGGGRGEEREGGHNTLLRQQPSRDAVSAGPRLPRPPP